MQHAKPSGTPQGTAPRLHSPALTHHPARAESAGATGTQARLAAAAGEEEEPRGGAAAGWTPRAGGVTTLPAAYCLVRSLNLILLGFCARDVKGCFRHGNGGVGVGWGKEQHPMYKTEEA